MVCIFSIFPAFLFFFFFFFSEAVRTWSLFVQRWTGHGRQISQRRLRYRVAGLRPSASQPSLLSFSHLSTFLLQFFPLSHFFSFFFLFSPFFHPPFLFFFPFFHSLPVIFHHFLQFHAFSSFFGQSDASPCDPLSAMCTTRHGILKRTRHVLKEDFCIFLGIFGTFKKTVSYLAKRQKRKVFAFT